MSDLSLRLQQASSQLPVSVYFDPALHQLERETLFQQGPRYVGHTHWVPNEGDYYVLPQEQGGRALVRTAQLRMVASAPSSTAAVWPAS